MLTSNYKAVEKKILILLVILVFSTNIEAQLRLKSAETYYQNLSYQDAIDSYSKQVKKERTNGEALFNLANAYRLNGRMTEAEIWFEQAVIYNPSPLCKLYYAQTLLSNSKYLKAKTWFLKFADQAPSANDANLARDMAVFCQGLEDNGMPGYTYIINEARFNSDLHDYGPFFYKDSAVVFVSNRGVKTDRNKKDKWTGENYMKLFITYVNHNTNDFTVPEKFLKNYSTRFHEGSLCFTSDYTKVYFTQNHVKNNRPIVDDNMNTLLAIYSADMIDGEYANFAKLPFNNEKYSVCHPTLSDANDYMIFASNMPGGLGGMDLYVVKREESGQWGVPENMGSKINTFGNEVFPFLDREDNLYYSSNMMVGFGGLDVYVATKSGKSWEKPINIGVPINGSKDDFGIVFGKDNSLGYFSSNRKGKDDIYRFIGGFEITNKKKDIDSTIVNEWRPSVCGTVINAKYKNLLKDAKVDVVSKCSGDETEIITLNDGAFDFPIQENCDYRISVSKKNFRDTIINFTTYSLSDKECVRITIPLTFIDNDKLISSNIIVYEGQVLELYNIYYDFDKFNIRTDASNDLDILYELLIKYPSMRGELSSHTDCRGTHAYNEKLATNRANSAVKYLIGKGIDAKRITAKGYGETKLKNECADGVDCTEIQHQRNRRTEFKVTYLNETIQSKEIETWLK